MFRDEMYEQIERRLDTLEDEHSIYSLVELVTSIAPTWDYMVFAIQKKGLFVTPDQSLLLLQLVYALGRKDSKFFNAIRPQVTHLVVKCYRVAKDRDSIRLFLHSWLMNAQWADLAKAALTTLRVADNRADFEAMAKNLSDTDLRKYRGKLTRPILQARLQALVKALNILYSDAT